MPAAAEAAAENSEQNECENETGEDLPPTVKRSMRTHHTPQMFEILVLVYV